LEIVMEILARARLGNDPQRVQTKTGTEMARGFAFLDIEGESGLPGLVGFNRIAGALLKYSKGDAIRISGTLQDIVLVKAAIEAHVKGEIHLPALKNAHNGNKSGLKVTDYVE